MGQLNELQIKAAQPRDNEYMLADGERLYLRVRPNGKVPGGFNWPLWAGQSRGFFAEQGLAVALTSTPNSVFQLTGLIGGEFDIAMTAICATTWRHPPDGCPDSACVGLNSRSCSRKCFELAAGRVDLGDKRPARHVDLESSCAFHLRHQVHIRERQLMTEAVRACLAIGP